MSRNRGGGRLGTALRIGLIVAAGAILAVLGWMMAPGGALRLREPHVPRTAALERVLEGVPVMPGAERFPALARPGPYGALRRLVCGTDRQEVLRYYAAEMPALGWAFSTATDGLPAAYAEHVLCFRKNGRVCIISVEEKSSYRCAVNILVF